MDEPDQYVDFMAKYRGWIAFKRMGIRPDTKPEEVAQHLAVIRKAIEARAYSLVGIDTAQLDSFAEKEMQGSKKGAAGLQKVADEVSSPQFKAAAESACKDRRLSPIAVTYAINRMLIALGYEAGLNPEKMVKAFPGLKPPKMPPGAGRAKKGSAEGQQFEEDGYVEFNARYKDWVAIRKMETGKGTDPVEVDAELGAIREEIDTKATSLIGIDTKGIDQFVHAALAGALAGKRGRPEVLGILLQSFAGKQAKEALAKASPDKKLEKMAESYMLNRLLAASLYSPGIDTADVPGARHGAAQKENPFRKDWQA